MAICDKDDLARMKVCLVLKLGQNAQLIAPLLATGSEGIIEDCADLPDRARSHWAERRIQHEAARDFANRRARWGNGQFTLLVGDLPGAFGDDVIPEIRATRSVSLSGYEVHPSIEPVGALVFRWWRMFRTGSLPYYRLM